METIENEVTTLVYNALVTELGADGFYFTSEYNAKPPKFPCVYVHEADNFNAGYNGCASEVITGVMYEVEVCSNKTSGRKSEAKSVMQIVDGVLTPLGFRRTLMQQIPNMSDATIFRMLARYSASVMNSTIYRR